MTLLLFGDLPKRDRSLAIEEIDETAFRRRLIESGAFILQIVDRKDYPRNYAPARSPQSNLTPTSANWLFPNADAVHIAQHLCHAVTLRSTDSSKDL